MGKKQRTVSGVIIAFRKSDKEVYWWYTDEGDADMLNLHNRMADWLANGNTFEILEYHPNGLSEYTFANTRAVWWDKQLHELGEDIMDGARCDD